MVAPDADRTGPSEEIDRLLQAASHLEHVAEDHEAVGPVLLEDRQRPPQVTEILVDVRQDADPHKLGALARGNHATSVAVEETLFHGFSPSSSGVD
jgi:hypothetical protein